jgi:uncharacterized protein (DUF488 family)
MTDRCDNGNMASLTIYTIGFTRHSAREFFTLLKNAGIRRLIDTRLNNVSQLAGFAKKADLAYFTETILGAEYRHMPILAPTQEMLDTYKKQKGGWERYRQDYLAIVAERQIEKELSPDLFSIPTALLCSEHTADHCHRKLVIEHLNRTWGPVHGEIRAVHL